MMSDNNLQIGEEFRLPDHFKLAQGQAFCNLVMFAQFDEIEARKLQIKPIMRSVNGDREGQSVEVILDEDCNGTGKLALPMFGDGDLTFALAVAYRVDQNDLMEITLTGEGLNPKEQRFLVNARRPAFVATPAMPSLAERARLPAGVILDEFHPGTHDGGFIADGVAYAGYGNFGDHPEHCPTGFEKAGADGLGAC